MFKNQRGGAAVEFAIVLFPLALILFGTIDFGLLFYNKQVITNASREGARAAIVAIYWNDTNDDGTPDTLTTIPVDIMEAYYSGRLINLGGEDDPPTSTIAPITNDPDEDFITATVTYKYNHLFSGITRFNETTLTGKTVMRKEW